MLVSSLCSLLPFNLLTNGTGPAWLHYWVFTMLLASFFFFLSFFFCVVSKLLFCDFTTYMTLGTYNMHIILALLPRGSSVRMPTWDELIFPGLALHKTVGLGRQHRSSGETLGEVIIRWWESLIGGSDNMMVGKSLIGVLVYSFFRRGYLNCQYLYESKSISYVCVFFFLVLFFILI